MAEALIKAVDFLHPDPAIDKRGAHKRGDVIVVMPDGHQWGAAEGPPKFEVISVPDSWLDYDRAQPLRETRAMRQSGALRRMPRLSALASRVLDRVVVKRHRYSVDLDNGNALIDHLPAEEN